MASYEDPPLTEETATVHRALELDLTREDRMRRIRVIQIATLALCGIGVMSVHQYWILGIPEICLALLLTMAAGIANLFLLRWTQRDSLCGHLALAILAPLLVYLSAVSGGFRDPSFAWFYLLPLAAGVLSGFRGGAFWLAVTVAITLGFWSLEARGISLPNRIPAEMRAGHDLYNRLTALMGLSLVVLSFVAGQRRAERSLGEANAELRRKSTYVRLLEFAAVAANEAATLDEAMHEAVKRICQAMGWPVGHIYTVEADGILHTTGAFYLDHEEPLAFPKERVLGTALLTGEGLPGRAVATGRPEGRYDLPVDPEQPGAGLSSQLGLRTALAIPVLRHGRVAAVLEFGLRERMTPSPRLLEVLALVGVQIGRVAERTAVQNRYRQAQKMEAIGRLSAGVAHEINNPMAYVRSNLNFLHSEWKSLRAGLEGIAGAAPLTSCLEDCEELIEETIEGVEQTVSIVRDMKEFAHAGDDNRDPTDLHDIVDSALRVASANAPSGVEIRRRDAGDLPPVSCVANQLNQVLLNIVVNAIEAVSPIGWVDVATCIEGELVVIQVEDNGPGMTEETIERLFDPFFTTKRAGEGTGLGLAISYEIVRNHGGEIRVISAPGAGTVIEVRLPLNGAARTT
jgi:signal transduction histidine kinase